MRRYIFSIFTASMGVQISDNISQLTGSTLYLPDDAIFKTSFKLGEIFIRLPPKNKKSLTEINLSRTSNLCFIRGATSNSR